jgi:hypothetical protein
MNSAWKSIAKLNTVQLAPGDSVLFEGGQSFPGTIILNSGDGNNAVNPVLISSFGQSRAIIDAGANSGIDLYNSQGFLFSRLLIKGAGMNANSGDGIELYTDLIPRAKNIRIENTEIYGFGKTGITIGAWNGLAGFENLTIEGVTVHDVLKNGIVSYGYTSQTHVGWAHKDIVIRNCEISNEPGFADPTLHKGSGIILGQVDGALIEHCVAHHNGSANIACGGPGGIWGYDSNNLIIQYCESYSNSAGTGCDGLGFDLDGGITNSIIQYCYSHDNDGAGILLGQYTNAREWKNNIVRFNVSVNDGRTNSGGITLFKGPGTVMHGVDIYHNTVYISKSIANSGAGAFTMTDWNTGIDSVRVLNNIFETEGGAALVYIPTGYSAMLTGNLYFPSSGNFNIFDQNHYYSSLATWRAATGKETFNSTPSGITADPLLTHTGTSPVLWPVATQSLNAYKPPANSPAVDAAIVLSAFGITAGSSDYYSSVFPSGPKGDIGAGEYYFASVTFTAANTSYSNSIASDTTAKPPVATGVTYGSDDGMEIVLYPNPLSPGQVLHILGVPYEALVEVRSLAGRKVAEFRGETEFLSENLTGGLYLVTIHKPDGRVVSKKLIVK